MGQKIENISKAFANPKTRGIFIVLAIVVLVAVSMGYLRIKTSGNTTSGNVGGSSVTATPAITSVPGTNEASQEYVRLQETQNTQLSETALRRGTAAIPTLTRVTHLETGVATASDENASCSAEELQRARNAGVTVTELRCRGCSLTTLRNAGFGAGELAAAGFSAKELKDAGFNADDLKAAGISVRELAQASFTARELAQLGYSAAELQDAGFNPQMLKSAGFNALDLKAAGVSAADMVRAGFDSNEIIRAGFATDELRGKSTIGKNCGIADLRKARTRGIRAEDIKKLQCSLAALRAAGFTAAELKNAGFSAKELKDAGFEASELKTMGFNAQELKSAGFSAQSLKDAGFDTQELKTAGISAGALRRAGFSAEALYNAGVNSKDLKKAGFSAQDLKNMGLNAQAVKDAGFSDGDLVRAGLLANYTSTDSSNIEGKKTAENTICNVEIARQARTVGASAQTLREKGCTSRVLRNAGFGVEELAKAGFTPEEVIASQQPSSEIGNAYNKAQPSVNEATNITNNTAYPNAIAPSGEQEDWQRQLAAIKEQQAQQISSQEYDDKVRQTQQAMSGQANDLFAAWVPLPTQQFVQGSTNKSETSASDAASMSDKNTGGTSSKQAQAINPNASVFKAGTVLFAVLDVGINSDEVSPIMATIVEGDLNGAKLLGDFRRVDTKVLLQFSVLNVPYLPSSVSINAVAIDPNTARTAMATHVDNHYLLRFGTAFAASFASGVGQALQNSGNSVSINTSTGQTINLQGDISAAKAAVIGLGEVGNKFSSMLSPLFNKPPTVEVKAGSGVGILLMSDLVIPKNKKTP